MKTPPFAVTKKQDGAGFSPRSFVVPHNTPMRKLCLFVLLGVSVLPNNPLP
jgi:hypothetical protein